MCVRVHVCAMARGGAAGRDSLEENQKVPLLSHWHLDNFQGIIQIAWTSLLQPRLSFYIGLCDSPMLLLLPTIIVLWVR